MKIFRNFVTFFAVFCSSVFGADILAPDGQLGEYVSVDDLQWNRYTTNGNFVVLSIDDNQGKWLAENLDRIRSITLSKWGLETFDSKAEVRIFCVPSHDLLKKLFSIEKPRIEKRDNLTVVWLVLGNDLSQDMSAYLDETIFFDYEQNTKKELPFWFKRGATLLANNANHINDELKELKNSFDSNKLLSTDRLFKMDPEAFDKESQENKQLYDRQAAVLCLMLRKEFGVVKMKSFLEISPRQGVEKSLQLIYSFNGVNHFSKQYVHYLRDLCSQAIQDKILASYLEVKPR